MIKIIIISITISIYMALCVQKGFQRAGLEVEFVCQPPPGVPPPTVTWHHNGKVIHESSQYQMHSEQILGGNIKSTLKIRHVQLSDAGSYVCKAENIANKLNSNPQQLDVHAKPKITSASNPSSKTIKSGGQIKVRCIAEGAPIPKIAWKFCQRNPRGDHCPEINENRKFQVEESREVNRYQRTSELRISSASLDNSGTYICTATNKVL